MRGYFGIGIEGGTKDVNIGNLFRCAHGFGASFVFTIAARYSRDSSMTDTSNARANLPLYEFSDLGALRLPEGSSLVGVELTPDAIELPRFHHPRKAAYVLGPERGSLSPALIELCDFVVRIPTRFAINLATAGAVVMYDRAISLHRYPGRPFLPGGPMEPLPTHVFGPPMRRTRRSPATTGKV